ncbi:MAG: hypothetical protein LBI95_04070, partial [Holosporales bacterium]|nr:hypothetical protein [Holosporales bacterium]
MKLKNNRILYIMCSALFSLSILSVADASLFLPKPKGKLPFASVPDLSKSTIAFKKNNTNFKPGLTISNRSFSPVKSNPIPNNSKPKINP